MFLSRADGTFFVDVGVDAGLRQSGHCATWRVRKVICDGHADDGGVVIVNNALNEVCNGVRDLDHDEEFATRLGTSRGQAQRLLAEVATLIERTERLPG